jgi:hypothetical protein
MIEFSCLCGEKFSLPYEMAGESFQCDKCSRLVIVPTLDDLEHLDSDGAYTIEEEEPEAHRRPELAAPRAESSIESIPLEELERPAPIGPRYDPFTGELIRPLKVEKFIPSAESLRPQRPPPLSKSRRKLLEPPPKWQWVLREMFRAHNSFVVAVVAALHIVIIASFIVLMGGLFFVVGFELILFSPIICQYALIIQDTGPAEKDELPTPLRDFQFKEDIWDPFIHFMFSFGVCLGPALFVHVDGDPRLVDTPITIVLALAGFFFFPAILMTATNDGTLVNFRPDRVWGVIRADARTYAAVAGMVMLGTLIYLDGMWGQLEWTIRLFHKPSSGAMPPWPWFLPGPALGFLMVVISLYMLYFACWELGIYWRRHHERFPWIHQRFTKQVAKDGSTPA